MNEQIQDAFDAILPPRMKARSLSGRRLDGYTLHELIDGGEGGFGVVYRATHEQMPEAAVKVLGVDITEEPAAYSRFQREIQLLVAMDSAANVVRVRDAGIVDNMPWFAMALVKGKPLDRWLEDRHSAGREVNTPELVAILRGILEGLEQVQQAWRDNAGSPTAARRGRGGRHATLVHRDIKPSNVMIEDKEGGPCVTLIDFGVAGLFAPRTSETSPAAVSAAVSRNPVMALTRQYVSPEMLLAADALDVRSDLFQVGLVAFEMMVKGRRYWAVGEPAKALAAAPRWPRWLKRIILRSLKWDPAGRFATPAEFRAALEHPYLASLRPCALARKGGRLVTLIAVVISVAATLIAVGIGHHSSRQLADAAKGLADATGQIAELKTERDRLLRNMPGATRPGDIYEQIKLAYGDFLRVPQSRTSCDLESMAGNCDRFLESAERNDVRRRPVQVIQAWLTSAKRGGQVKVYMDKLLENTGTLWSDKPPLVYRIEGPGGTSAQGSWAVKNSHFFPQDGPNHTLLVKWDVSAEVKLTLKRDKDSTENLIRLCEDDVLCAPSRRTRCLKLKDIEMWVWFERVGFGPLPPPPP